MDTSILKPIEDFCDRNQLPWGGQHADGMLGYLELLLKFNASMNLIGPLSPQQVVHQLLLDSLVAAACYPDLGEGSVLDVGSGAGLPGLPLQFLFPEVALTLVEPRKKRTLFLTIVKQRLGLRTLRIERCRLEHLTPATYDTLISKAFCPPLTWLERAKPWLAPQRGAVICMTRRHMEPELDQKANVLGLAPVGRAEAPRDTPQTDPEDRVVFAYGVPPQ